MDFIKDIVVYININKKINKLMHQVILNEG